jgi:DNA mismatch repair protein MutS
MDRAHGKDMAAIKNALASFEAIDSLVREISLVFEEDGVWSSLGRENTAALLDLKNLLERGIAEDPSILLTEGKLIRKGYSEKLDELHQLRDNGRRLLETYLEEERLKTGIQSLKIRYNRLIGYFFEVTKAQLSKVPPHFIRRQGIVGGERYSTERLAALESDINGASDKVVELEKELFLEIRDKAKALIPDLSAAARRIAALDAAQSLSRAASIHGWVRPLISDENSIRITEGRHPVVEAHLNRGEFIPNDTVLDGNGIFFALITGPNMAGKSTYLRQTALITIMAQMGSFVPARDAEIGIVDRIYCRVGASDNLARGESTFLVEMNETAYILHTATEQSLVIMDEVGRGTGTNDGLSIAWAVSEELLEHIRCRTLFATHYHELAKIPHPRMANRSMEVLDRDGEIVFLRKLQEGPTGESYGIHVAALAGIPGRVIERAGEIMEKLTGNAGSPGERNFPGIAGTGGGGPKSAKPDKRFKEFLSEIAALNPDSMTPMDALNQLYAWKRRFGAKPLPDNAELPAAKSHRGAGEAFASGKPPREAEPSLFD